MCSSRFITCDRLLLTATGRFVSGDYWLCCRRRTERPLYPLLNHVMLADKGCTNCVGCCRGNLLCGNAGGACLLHALKPVSSKNITPTTSTHRGWRPARAGSPTRPFSVPNGSRESCRTDPSRGGLFSGPSRSGWVSLSDVNEKGAWPARGAVVAAGSYNNTRPEISANRPISPQQKKNTGGHHSHTPVKGAAEATHVSELPSSSSDALEKPEANDLRREHHRVLLHDVGC